MANQDDFFSLLNQERDVKQSAQPKWDAHLSLGSTNLFCGHFRFIVVFLLSEDDGEHSVGPAAGLVHVGGRHRPEQSLHTHTHEDRNQV